MRGESWILSLVERWSVILYISTVSRVPSGLFISIQHVVSDHNSQGASHKRKRCTIPARYNILSVATRQSVGGFRDRQSGARIYVRKTVLSVKGLTAVHMKGSLSAQPHPSSQTKAQTGGKPAALKQVSGASTVLALRNTNRLCLSLLSAKGSSNYLCKA